MKKIIFGSAILMAMMLFSSCASYQKTAPILGVKDNAVATYVKADIDFASQKRVEGVVDKRKLFWCINLVRNGNKTLKNTTRYGGLSKIESQALYRAKENGNVDIILEPQFESEKHSWFFGIYKTYRTTVKGWGVNIKGFEGN